MRILYSSIDKINKPHNVQLKLHSSIPFSIKNHSYLCSVIFGQEEKNKNKTGRNVKAEQKKPQNNNSSIIQCSNLFKHFIFSSKMNSHADIKHTEMLALCR